MQTIQNIIQWVYDNRHIWVMIYKVLLALIAITVLSAIIDLLRSYAGLLQTRADYIMDKSRREEQNHKKQ